MVVASIDVEDEHWVLVSAESDVVGCPTCGVRAVGHGRSVVHVRDLPIAGRPVRQTRRTSETTPLD